MREEILCGAFLVLYLLGPLLAIPMGLRLVYVKSGSMIPTLFPGDLVLVQRPSRLRPGDIVVFRTDDGLVIHRLMGVRDGTAYTKGDANRFGERFPERLIVYKVVSLMGVPIHFPLAGFLYWGASILRANLRKFRGNAF